MLIKNPPGCEDPLFAEVLGNSFADEHAKTALKHHPSWSQNEIEQAEDLLSMFEEFIKHVARTLAAFGAHPKHLKCFEVNGTRKKKSPLARQGLG